MADENTVDYYALLGIDVDASAKQIRTAYRQKSLKVHPDRNPDNPQAAQLFHELSIANDTLIDPIKRESYDVKYKARQARAERFKTLDSKRKGFAEDLAAREDAYKKARSEERTKERNEQAELDRLKSEGEKLRKAKEQKYEETAKQLQDEEDRRRQSKRDADAQLGPLDTTVRLKWPRKAFPSLELDKDAIRALLPAQAAINVDSIVISGKVTSNPKLKSGTAVVSFKTLTSAVVTVEASGQGKLAGIEVSWASGQEPDIIAKQRAGAAASEEHHSRASELEDRTISAKVPKLDETSVLDQLRARERERERIEEEIRQQDEAEEASEVRP